MNYYIKFVVKATANIKISSEKFLVSEARYHSYANQWPVINVKAAHFCS